MYASTFSSSHLIRHTTGKIYLKYCCYGVKQKENRALFYVKQQNKTQLYGYISVASNVWQYTLMGVLPVMGGAIPLRNQATRILIQYPNQPHYSNTELTSPYHVLGMPSTRLGSNK